jgi:hypothetical protein
MVRMEQVQTLLKEVDEFQWWAVYISLSIMLHQLYLFLSTTSISATVYNIQPTITSVSTTSIFSLPVSITIFRLNNFKIYFVGNKFEKIIT